MLKQGLVLSVLVSGLLSGIVNASSLTDELKQALNTKINLTKGCDSLVVEEVSYCMDVKGVVTENGNEYYLLRGVPFDNEGDIDTHVATGLMGAIAKKNDKFGGVAYQPMGSWGKAPAEWRYTYLKGKLVWFAEDVYMNGGVSETYLKMIDENGKYMFEDVQIGFDDLGRCDSKKCEKNATAIKGVLMNRGDQIAIQFTGKKDGKKVNKLQELKWNDKSQQYTKPKDYLL